MKLPRFIRKAIYGAVNGVTVGDRVCDAWMVGRLTEIGEVVGFAWDYRAVVPKLRPLVQWKSDYRVDHCRHKLALVRDGQKTVNQARADFGLEPLIVNTNPKTAMQSPLVQVP